MASSELNKYEGIWLLLLAELPLWTIFRKCFWSTVTWDKNRGILFLQPTCGCCCNIKAIKKTAKILIFNDLCTSYGSLQMKEEMNLYRFEYLAERFSFNTPFLACLNHICHILKHMNKTKTCFKQLCSNLM